MGNIVEDPRIHNKVSVFHDRCDAGKRLGMFIKNHIPTDDAIICTIPSGGIPIGVEISLALFIPLAILVVRKIQIPWNTEAGFGSMTWDGRVYLNRDLLEHISLSQKEINSAVNSTKKSIQERLERYRRGHSPVQIRGKTVIVTDDGLASGYTMLAAVNSLRDYDPAGIIVAVPTGSLSAVSLVAPRVDTLICLNLRSHASFAVADAYESWHDLTDAEVENQLTRVPETSVL
jgi:putative phosphoribosyl transferase